MKRLEGKVAVITGGTGGIGLATAKLFLSEGAKVHLVDLSESNLKLALASLESTSVSYSVADVSEELRVKRYIQDAVQKWGGLDILFDNAGIESSMRPIIDCGTDEFERVINVNLKGVWLGIKYAAPEMKKRGGGSIICTSSVAGIRGFANASAYVASKHGVVGVVKCASQELAGDGIRVNAINPGPVDNRMMRDAEKAFNPKDPQGIRKAFEARIPLGRYAQNEEIARLALFLASDESSYITGAIHVIDGGMTVG